MFCDSCKKSIPPGTAICPHCGQWQLPPDEKRRQQRRIIVAIVASSAILIVWRYLFPTH
jgi:predicted nucleic acid-binding Zn ribbon protein